MAALASLLKTGSAKKPMSSGRPKPVAVSMRTLTYEGYVMQDSLMNGSETKVVHELQRPLWGRYHVSTKVRLADIAKATGKDNRQRMSLFGRIKSRHVDFVIHDFSGRIVCAVEYDGPTHRRKSEADADAFKDGLFQHIGLPLVRISHTEEFHGAIGRILERAGLAQAVAA